MDDGFAIPVIERAAKAICRLNCAVASLRPCDCPESCWSQEVDFARAAIGEVRTPDREMTRAYNTMPGLVYNQPRADQVLAVLVDAALSPTPQS